MAGRFERQNRLFGAAGRYDQEAASESNPEKHSHKDKVGCGCGCEEPMEGTSWSHQQAHEQLHKSAPAHGTGHSTHHGTKDRNPR